MRARMKPTPVNDGDNWSPLLVAALLWASFSWVVALLTPRIALLPHIEAIHVMLPIGTVGFILILLCFAARQYFLGTSLSALLENTAVQLVLFTVLFFQLSAHLGAELYKFDREPNCLDWCGFSLAHAVRASDVLDIVEAYGLRIQTVAHSSWIVGASLVLYHFVVNVFVLGLVSNRFARALKWLKQHSDLNCPAAYLLLLCVFVWVVSWWLMAFHLRPWNAVDFPLWFVDNSLRFFDTVDALDSFQIRLHSVPREFPEATLACGFRLLMAVGIGLWFEYRTAALKRNSAPRKMAASVPPQLGTATLWGLALFLLIFCFGGLLLQTKGRTASLVTALHSDDPQKVRQSLAAIRRMGSAAAVLAPELEKSIPHLPATVQTKGVETLGFLGPEAIPALANIAMASHPELSLAAVEALYCSGVAATSELIRVQSKASNPTIREKAAQYLSDIPIAEAVAIVIRDTTRENLVHHIDYLRKNDPYWNTRPITHHLVIAVRQKDVALKQVTDRLVETRTNAVTFLAPLCGLMDDVDDAIITRLRDPDDQVKLTSQSAVTSAGVGILPKLLTQDLRPRQFREHVKEIILQIGSDSVPVLVPYLWDQREEIRLLATDLLKTWSAETAPVLLEYAIGSKTSNRAAAWTALATVAPKWPTEPRILAKIADLMKRLEAPEEEVKQITISALGAIGPSARAALAGLLRLSATQFALTRQTALKAVEKVAQNWAESAEVVRVIPEWLENLGDLNPERRGEIQSMLLKVCTVNGGGISVVVVGLTHLNVTIREATLAVFVELGPKGRSAMSTVVSLLADPVDKVRVQAAAALPKIHSGWSSLPETRAALPLLLSRLYKQSPVHPGNHQGLFILLQNRDSNLRMAGVRLLAEFGPGAKDAIPTLFRCLSDDDQRFRIAIVETLTRIDPEWTSQSEASMAISHLVCLLEANDDRLQESGMIHLGRMGPKAKESVPKLLTFLANRDEVKRAASITTLSKIGRPAVSALVRCLTDSDATTRASAEIALRLIDETWPQLPDTVKMIPAITETLTDENIDRRRAAIKLLGQIGPAAREAVPMLVVRLENEGPPMRDLLASAMARIGSVAIKALVEQLNDRQVDRRTLAFLALGKCGKSAAGALPALREKLQDRDPLIRGLAAFTLGQLGTTAAIPGGVVAERHCEQKNSRKRKLLRRARQFWPSLVVQGGGQMLAGILESPRYCLLK